MVERKLRITENTQISYLITFVFQCYIPQFHRIPHGNRQFLACLYPTVFTFIDGIRHTMAACIICLFQRFTDRLPGNTPVILRFVVPQIHIMSRPVHGNAVSPEPCYPVIFLRLIKHVSPCRMVYHHTGILHPEVICPGSRQIHFLNDIFPPLIIKIPITHPKTPPCCFSCLHYKEKCFVLIL